MTWERFNFGDALIYLFFIIFSASIILPFWHLLSISFSPGFVATAGGLSLWPTYFTLDNYDRVFSSRFIWMGYRNTIIRTVFGTVIQLFFTALGAYALSKKFFPHRSMWTFLIVFTMFFSGGLIPTFMVVRNLGLIDTYASMILPGLIGAFNLIIMRNYFMAMPEEIEESCMMDGAGRFRIFFQMVIPLAKPIIATVALWLAVGHWNAWFDVLIYITDENMFVLQIILRRILIQGTQQMLEQTGIIGFDDNLASPAGVQAAAIYVATVPILMVYPFIQKYFVKGIMIGSLKG